MKILLLYYTGTYNTRYVTERLKERFVVDNNFVDEIEVNGDTKPISLEKYDLIGLGYPIYAFNVPVIYVKYLKKLVFNTKAKYFIYKNSGETEDLNNSSSNIIYSILKRRKCLCQNEYHIVMPYTIHFKFDDNFVKQILLYLNKQLDIIVYDLKNNQNSVIKTTKKLSFISYLYRIQRIGGFFNSMFYKVDYSKCLHCDMCLNNCPVHNIKLKNNKYVFGRKCLMCMRCSFMCPENAIKIGLYDKWRVNGPYHYEKINNLPLNGDYINEESNGFYHCFIKTFNDIDTKHQEIEGKLK